MNQYAAYGITMTGAMLWGVTGFFVQNLYEFGFSPWDVVTIRLTVSTLLLLVLLILFKPTLLRVHVKDLLCFIGLGVISIAFFNWFYFQVMERASLSIAVILLYTNPVFVTLISRFIFKEPIDFRKIIALMTTMIGCGFVVGFLPSGQFNVSYVTILFGFAAAFFCSLYSILGKAISQRYHTLTTTVYAMLCGTVFLVPTSQIWEKTESFLNKEVWIYIIGISIFSTLLAYSLYTYGLTYIESSRAAILTAFEPIIALLIGILIFGDTFTSWQILGSLLIFFSIYMTIFTRRYRRKHSSLYSKS